MKYTVEDVIDGPLDEVVEICLDRSRDVDVYPNVTKTEVKKRERKGNKMYQKVETLANGDIPPKLRKLISEKMLSWTEEGEFDFDTNEYKYKVKTHYFTNVTKVGGHFKYYEKNGKTVRHLDGYVNINIPVLGKIAEKKIAQIQKENLKQIGPSPHNQNQHKLVEEYRFLQTL